MEKNNKNSLVVNFKHKCNKLLYYYIIKNRIIGKKEDYI